MTINLVKVPGSGFLSSLPQFQYWDEVFAADSRITGMWEAAASKVTIVAQSGVDRVSALTDMRDGVATAITQASADARPEWLPTGGPGGRPAMRFNDQTGGDEYLTLPFAWPTSSDWSKLVLYNAPSSALSNFGLFGTQTSDTGRHFLMKYTTGSLGLQVGSNVAGQQVLPLVASPDDTWLAALGGWAHTAKRAGVRHLGGALVTASDPDVVVGSGDVHIGRASRNVKITLAMSFNVDLNSGDHNDLVALLERYIYERFALSF